ncbi:MAG: cupredoxin domain-containing protein [Sporichthyaceae bacterium]
MHSRTLSAPMNHGRLTIAVTAAALTAAAGLLIAGSGPSASAFGLHLTSADATSAGTEVPIKNNDFGSVLTIKLGESITWLNNDAAPHTVTTTTAPVAFDSGVFEQGQRFTYKFTTPGTYDFYCAVHPEMIGQVVVLGKNGKPVKESKPADKPADKPAADPVSALIGPLLGGPHHSSSANPTGDKPDPTTEHTPSTHGDNTTESAAVGKSDNGAAPSAGTYPYQPAADPVSGAVDPLITHLEAAHFNRGAGAQVQDIAEFDSWSKSHQFLVRQMTEFFQGKDSAYGAHPILGQFAKHMDNAHYNTSPMGQASAILNFDSWNKSHLALIRQMLDAYVGKTSMAGTTPAARVFMQHLDAGHWNTSINGQVTAITDDLPGWLASHQALAEAMAADGSKGAGAPTGQGGLTE